MGSGGLVPCIPTFSPHVLATLFRNKIHWFELAVLVSLRAVRDAIQRRRPTDSRADKRDSQLGKQNAELQFVTSSKAPIACTTRTTALPNSAFVPFRQLHNPSKLGACA